MLYNIFLLENYFIYNKLRYSKRIYEKYAREKRVYDLICENMIFFLVSLMSIYY